MHLEIDKIYFNGNRVGVDFEYDEDFLKEVSNVCGSNRLSKKELQLYIMSVLTDTISQEYITELRQYLD
jgi:uncharacterized protein (DUF2267 family)